MVFAVPESPVQRALKDVFMALEQRDLHGAARLLQRISGDCEGMPAQPACPYLAGEIAVARGRLLLAERQNTEAIVEFESALRSCPKIRPATRRCAEAERTVAELSGKLARVVIRTRIGEECKEDRLWLNPGPQSVKVSGVLTEIAPQEGQILSLGSCK